MMEHILLMKVKDLQDNKKGGCLCPTVMVVDVVDIVTVVTVMAATDTAAARALR
jgi:hypothetical protein